MMVILWKIVYWSVFALCWAALPLAQHYEMAGDFTVLKKCMTALLRHLRTFLIMLIVFALFLIYLAASGNFDQQNLPVFLVVISNTWGLFLIMMLLGYGLIAIPRLLWNKGNLSGYLNYYQFQATVVDEAKVEARYALDQTVKLICVAAKSLGIDDPLMECVEIMTAKIPASVMNQQLYLRPHENKEAVENLGKVTESRLTNLHKDLKKALAEYVRANARWNSVISKAFKIEDICNNRDNPGHKIVSYLWKSPTGRFARTREVLEWVWFTRLQPVVFRLMAVMCAFLSVLVILGEVTLFLSTPVGLFPLMFNEDHGNFGTQVLCSIPLVYIVWSAYYAQFSLKMPGFYGIYGHNQTDPSNLLWCAAFLCKLTSPLSFNFLLFIKVKGSAFSKVMGIIDFVPVFGSSFSEFFPLILLLFCAMNLFQIYSRVMSWLGMSQFRFSESLQDEKLIEGKALLQKARLDIEKEFISIKTPGGNAVGYGGYTTKVRGNLTKKLIEEEPGEDGRRTSSIDEEKEARVKEDAVAGEKNLGKEERKSFSEGGRKKSEIEENKTAAKSVSEERKKKPPPVPRPKSQKPAKSEPRRVSGASSKPPKSSSNPAATGPSSLRDRLKQYYK